MMKIIIAILGILTIGGQYVVMADTLERNSSCSHSQCEISQITLAVPGQPGSSYTSASVSKITNYKNIAIRRDAVHATYPVKATVIKDGTAENHTKTLQRSGYHYILNMTGFKAGNKVGLKVTNLDPSPTAFKGGFNVDYDGTNR